MTSAIRSGSVYPTATPALLYSFFMDSAKHTAATGMPAKISNRVGGKWSAFGGKIFGKSLVLIPNRRIVQTWRSSEWKKADPDSILVVSFEKSPGGGAQVELDHVGVPEYDQEGVTQGWMKFYWDAWNAYLAQRKPRGRQKPQISS